jgi:hypothetical protein
MKRLLLCIAFIGCGTEDIGHPGPDAAAPVCLGPGSCPSSCAAGSVCATSFGAFNRHAPTCLKACKVSGDCGGNLRCADLFGEMLGTAVCIADTLPAPCGQVPLSYHCDFPPATCKDGQTLARPFSQASNGTCGHELVACPNGCVEGTFHGGLTPAFCR